MRCCFNRDNANWARRRRCRNRPRGGVRHRVPNPHQGTDYLSPRITCPEFTSICPVTGQPDFGILVIDYLPGEWLVESKSLKLYLSSFRNHGAFHEDCTVGIASGWWSCLSRDGSGSAATGIRAVASPSNVFWQTGEAPKASGCRNQAWRPIAGVDEGCCQPTTTHNDDRAIPRPVMNGSGAAGGTPVMSNTITTIVPAAAGGLACSPLAASCWCAARFRRPKGLGVSPLVIGLTLVASALDA